MRRNSPCANEVVWKWGEASRWAASRQRLTRPAPIRIGEGSPHLHTQSGRIVTPSGRPPQECIGRRVGFYIPVVPGDSWSGEKGEKARKYGVENNSLGLAYFPL